MKVKRPWVAFWVMSVTAVALSVVTSYVLEWSSFGLGEGIKALVYFGLGAYIYSKVSE